MAFAPPNARKVKFQRDQERAERLRVFEAGRAAAIAAETAAKQRRQEVRSCYQEHAPAQLVHAGEMMRCGTIIHGDPEVVGRSRGGKTRGALRICRVISQVAA